MLTVIGSAEVIMQGASRDLIHNKNQNTSSLIATRDERQQEDIRSQYVLELSHGRQKYKTVPNVES
ncbi:MAG: hypothetical protein CMN32_08510 [Saprospirales bacterium]|nr:hypothetical protein [Saprospirales bacterium]